MSSWLACSNVSTMSAPGRIGWPGKWSSNTSSVAVTFLRISIARPGSTATRRSTKRNRMPPVATRAAGGPPPSGSGGEPRDGRELPRDVVAERADGEPVHHLFDGHGRMQVLDQVL